MANGLNDYLSILDLQNRQAANDRARDNLANALKQRENFGYSFAQALANMPQQQGYGSWLGNAANAFGGAFGARTNAAIDRAQKEYDTQVNQTASDLNTALKFAQVSNQEDANAFNRQLKLDELAAKNIAKQEAENEQAILRQSAQKAILELKELADSGEITASNKSNDQWFLSSSSSRNLGRRAAALSALLPLTNAVAKASGGSGINTISEMMAYLGIPENATSAQIAGALPLVASKLGLSYDSDPAVKSTELVNNIFDNM